MTSIRFNANGSFTMTCLPEETVARALFDTDEEVLSYVRSRADLVIWHSPTCASVKTKATVDKAMQKCWDIDDKGFRSRCLARAARMVEVMGS